MLTYQELKSMTKKELLKELTDAREAMMKKRITVKTKHDKDTSSVNKQKKLIARIKTAIKEAELEEMIEQSKKID
jgi:ribosomal protein L29